MSCVISKSILNMVYHGNSRHNGKLKIAHNTLWQPSSFLRNSFSSIFLVKIYFKSNGSFFASQTTVMQHFISHHRATLFLTLWHPLSLLVILKTFSRYIHVKNHALNPLVRFFTKQTKHDTP